MFLFLPLSSWNGLANVLLFLGSEVVCTLCYCVVSSEEAHDHFSSEAHCERYLVSLPGPRVNNIIRKYRICVEIMRVAKRGDKHFIEDININTDNIGNKFPKSIHNSRKVVADSILPGFSESGIFFFRIRKNLIYCLYSKYIFTLSSVGYHLLDFVSTLLWRLEEVFWHLLLKNMRDLLTTTIIMRLQSDCLQYFAKLPDRRREILQFLQLKG